MGSGVPAAWDEMRTGHRRQRPVVVVVTGLPGAGKTTVSRALSKALTLPLLSKDAIKQSLFDVLGIRDREWSLQLGLAANRVLWTLLSHCPAGAIVDMWLDPIRDVGVTQEGLALADVRTAYEVICDCPAELAVECYAGRVRHPGHLPSDQATLQRIHDSSILMTALGIGPTKRIDTTRPVDIPALVEWLRRSEGAENSDAGAPVGRGPPAGLEDRAVAAQAGIYGAPCDVSCGLSAACMSGRGQ